MASTLTNQREWDKATTDHETAKAGAWTAFCAILWVLLGVGLLLLPALLFKVYGEWVF